MVPGAVVEGPDAMGVEPGDAEGDAVGEAEGDAVVEGEGDVGVEAGVELEVVVTPSVERRGLRSVCFTLVHWARMFG